MAYAIQYNTQTQCLEFNYRDCSHSLALNSLFHEFELSLANIVLEICNVPVRRTSNGLDLNTIQYCSDTVYNELITDIVFLHGIYREHRQHHIGFINEQKFTQWKEAIQNVNQAAILKALYLDDKISRPYFFKYVCNHPASLKELIKYSLFVNNTFGTVSQIEKIDKLPLPIPIKEDLKLSFVL